MLPVCYPSSPSPTTGLPEAVAYALSSVSGLTRWVDYIPVKLVSGALGVNEQSTNVGGFTPMRLLGSAIGMAAWRDYIPVYVDNSATEAWVTSDTGYIPYANSVGMASEPSYYLNLSAPSNVTIADGQANGTITSTYNAVITASMSPSRITGVAPLYVNFDMTGTTSSASTNPTHECFFATDFGDSGAGVFANGVQSAGLTSKNAGYGPVTGHVYETPGTYYPSMTVLDGDGNLVTKTGTVVVDDPDAVYAGALTICISHSNNFTGAPSGATQVYTSGNTDMYAAWNTHKASNKRILFCKADSWTASATVSLDGYTGVFLGGYGTGVAHTFASGTLVPVTPATGINILFQGGGSTDCHICNFKITADATHSAVSAYTADSVAWTLYKIEVRGATGGFDTSTGGSGAAFCRHDQHCVYECLVDDVYGYAGATADTPRFTGAVGAVGTPGIFTATGHKFQRFNKVELVGTPPTGLSTGTSYYISASNLTANTFSLSSTLNTDTPLTISGIGTCEVRAQSLGGGIGAFVAMTRGGFMGNYLDACNHGEQTLRMPYVHTSHINNNYLARPNQGKNVFKIHCRGYDDISSVSSGYSEKIVITANVMDLRGGYSYGEAIPNNGQTATFVGTSDIVIGNGGVSLLNGGERCRNTIIQHNFTYACLGYSKDSYGFASVGCSNVTVRNNIADFSIGNRTTTTPGNYAYTGMYFGSVSSSLTQEQTVGVRFYNNTSYSNLSDSETADFVYVGLPDVGYADVDDLKIQNNIWYYPFAATPSKAAYRTALAANPTNVVATYNTDSVSGGGANTSPNFVATPPVALTDWRPTTGYAVNQGVNAPVLRDFNNASRYGAAYDLGAVLP